MQFDNLPICEENIWQGSERLYIFFTGVLGKLGLPTFEFFRSGGILDYSKLIIRDPYPAWYLRGIPAIGDSVHHVASFLKTKIEQSGATEIYFVGNSMGGFAAILLCSLVGMGKAIAVAPQTFLSPEMMAFHRETRIPKILDDLYLHRNEHHIYDLKPWLKQHSPDISVDLYLDGTFQLDIAHAEELAGFKNVKIHRLSGGQHSVLNFMHSQNLIQAMLSPRGLEMPRVAAGHIV